MGRVGSQAAEQIIAGVVLSERLAVTMYGAIHRASHAGQRNLRGLILDGKLLADETFRANLTKGTDKTLALEHGAIVPTVSVEDGGQDIVVITRGIGRYVTVQDLIESARAHGKKLPREVAAAVAKRVVGALAAAHKAGVVHGAVHPRSVLIDETGDVRLGDFVVGRALTTAVAQGADSALWRGLSGYIAPELVVGEDPTPAADVFAAGGLMFTMISGELPPGTVNTTPAVERLVQRCLDTDLSRRYKSAADLLENLEEAFEDDRWTIADRGEIIKAAGLQSTDQNVDDATEDLLASLGSKTKVTVTAPIRPSVDLRAESTRGKSIDALLSELDDNTGMTRVDDLPFKRDPISEIIQRDPRKKEAIVQVKARVPSLDDPDDDEHTPLPLPLPPRDSDVDIKPVPRSATKDEANALAALDDLDAVPKAKPAAKPIQPIIIDDQPTPNLRSPFRFVIYLLLLGGMGLGGYMIYTQYTKQEEQLGENAEKKKREQAEKDELEARLRKELPDPGAIHVAANPSESGVWLKLGHTPLDTMPLSSDIQHEIRLEGVAGYDPIDAQVNASAWTGEKKARKASVSIPLKASGKTPKKLTVTPPKPPDAGVLQPGRGPIHIESSPAGAEVWLYLGVAGQAQLEGIQAGLPYEIRVLSDGYQPGFITISPEDWRADKDTSKPLSIAKKKPRLDVSVDLVPDPNAPKKK